MAYNVSIHQDVEYQDVAKYYGKALEDWLNTGILPDRFGNEGQWEDNPRLCNSFVYKLHIKLPSEKPWKKNKAQIDRTSNVYLVYTRHWMDYGRIQIISIMAPDAHEKSRTSFMAELERRAEEFQNS
ncbi:type II toxin-antitoxin system YafO family toxin [Escherichia coli]|uniref:type II toxin-antitoxin system YafO family toxin n=1 Tax=Escherichia coli TaxID=562 RepID=UPI000DA52E72|nr:type II toxin-antitoxin system YafO family toxin [Escherichia coli]EEW2300101.1 type II toxin-antitoxin system YafO family toxin [Escherichia coli]EFH6212895.1 type II toxin-antitoxin system YafO family toxin [Escherichia coli]EFH9514535.1 type II toxin-antitoxin system YafO family toxin [Escherichia coli]EFI2446359.1 type II toxin-antitoxin system YafO family toxin [Escherichia coli]EFJ3028317.1 type II toxin-antitoxin system YafO family toxin [Escherichia coli]